MMRQNWWKYVTVALLLYTLIGGFLMPVPPLNIIHESIRNLYFHVPMWFAMMTLFTIGFVYSIKFLRAPGLKNDIYAVQFTNGGLLFGLLGLVTGMEWANYTWGEPWSNDPKQLGAALSLMIYCAYLVLRGAIPDPEKKAKIAAVYNVFAYALMFPLLFMIPSLTDSLHPGSGGNTGFNTYDLDNEMRKVFYPACIGWIGLSIWITTLLIRIKLIQKRDFLNEDFAI